jgi:uncharacterized membrane protein YeaQ/YmgE (transglycosylase-associated protein family)
MEAYFRNTFLDCRWFDRRSWLAGMVMKGGGYGLVGDIIVGVVGGLLGGWIASSLLHIGAGSEWY